MSTMVLALDQGTTSSRSILFTRAGQIAGMAQQEFPQIFPTPGHVEHDPEAIWNSQLHTAKRALADAKINAAAIAAIGITNQRETVVLWDKTTGKPVHNAIVWQSRISAGICDALKSQGHEAMVREKTGLVIDAYFSGTKIKYLLDTIPGLKARAEAGDILCGTIDTWLLWRMTSGAVHATDYSNASRTMLFNIRTLQWDDELLRILDIPPNILPQVKNSSGVFGETDPRIFGRAIPIAGIAGDQQSATFGQGCFAPGMAKNTYGTGCFLLKNIGHSPVMSSHGLLTTIGWGIDGKITYCLEGAVFIAGAAVQWLRDGLKVIHTSAEVETLAATVPDSAGVFFVPAFVGLGTPHWDQRARGTIVGLTQGTTAANLARATLDAMAFQTRDVVTAMEADSGMALADLRVDGGAAVNNGLMQFQADILGKPVHRPVVVETTALGAAYLAGLAVGFWQALDDVEANRALDRTFTPNMDTAARENSLAGWHRAIAAARAWAGSTPE